jgi:maltooligosyltrehalose trehalohydrolase
MLFQGQEFAASTPFLYFADHKPDLAASVKKGRAEFLAQFRSIATPEAQACLPDPGDVASFEQCKLDFEERRSHAPVYALHRDLLKLRREDPVFRSQRPRALDGAVLGEEAFVLRFFAEDGDDRLLVINLGRDVRLAPAPQPLLAPPLDHSWKTLWSSEDPRYGGSGTPTVETEEGWRIPGRSAVALFPQLSERTSL